MRNQRGTVASSSECPWSVSCQQHARDALSPGPLTLVIITLQWVPVATRSQSARPPVVPRQGCPNKIAQTVWLEHLSFFSHSPEAGSPRSRWKPIRFLLRPLSLARPCLPSLCAPMWPFLCVHKPLVCLFLCPNFLLLQGHQSDWSRTTPRASFQLNQSLKTLPPNSVTFWGPGVRTSTYESEEDTAEP